MSRDETEVGAIGGAEFLEELMDCSIRKSDLARASSGMVSRSD